MKRRIAAVVLPDFAIELATAALGLERAVRGEAATDARQKSLAVVITDPGATGPIKATARLDAVNAEARRYGVREGQSIAEACALVANLVVRELSRAELSRALGRAAEVALGFGATVAFEAPDTVWIDVTGSAHLFGGEIALGTELVARVRALGHVARVVIASGPRIAQALGRWCAPEIESPGERGVGVVRAGRDREAIGALPVAALPIEREHAAWLARLGVLTWSELVKIPRASAATRLGDGASLALDLCEGRDEMPLEAYRPPSLLAEETNWDEPVSGISPLLFVLRGLAARVSARLCGRGEAAQKLVLAIRGDPAIARHEGVRADLELVFDLASPLWREEEIRRVVGSRLERVRLQTPSVGLGLEVPAIIRALGRQLDFSRVSAGVTQSTGMESLPVLLAELGADIGKERVGVLALSDTHRPEKKSALRPALEHTQRVGGGGGTKPTIKKARRPGAPGSPSRWLTEPLRLDVALRVGATLRIEHRLYTVEQVDFVERLEAVEWWTEAPVARDYVRLWLSGAEGGLEALVYVDRTTGKRFLHAVAD